MGPESAFRNKAKLAVGGTKSSPTFGILDAQFNGVDLRDCGLYEPALAAALPALTGQVAALGLMPFDVPARSGELKHLIVTASPDGELMVRFVLRSPGQLPRIRRGLDSLRAAVPAVRVVSVNLQPEHKAVLEGEEEMVLTQDESLAMRLDDITFRLRPGSFFQTNSVVAAGLYRQAREWVSQVDPDSVLDLYCGVGGFALNAAMAKAAHTRRVEGVEVAPEAVASARTAATQLGVAAHFRIGDASALERVAADLVIVNPPRRGIGARLCAALASAAPAHIIYSSCNATSLARDLGDLPGYRVERARLFDMFPQTRHHEVMVLLSRR
ncbi:methyltransferase domain-containing protein [Janibacter cremeus]|uniref:23S rRNA (Uracil747-C5)-methyltransferase n=1 Tax=Janibacter cremeus TaxID=1285192 RepID=A0A852VSS1_9MICO|nr:methyltransferase domain-containing protein [Janibacter cremeus]NYF96661.1 23S rRNA (uracil747-C5)-methyltransferase [Janibacter cremeus]